MTQLNCVCWGVNRIHWIAHCQTFKAHTNCRKHKNLSTVHSLNRSYPTLSCCKCAFPWTVVLEKTLESSLDCKEIQPVNPKWNHSRIFIGRTDAKAETPILWPPDAKNWLLGKDPDAGKDWRWEEKGTTEDECLHGITDSMDMSLSKLWELVTDREAWHAAVHEGTEIRTWLSNWTELELKDHGKCSQKLAVPWPHPRGLVVYFCCHNLITNSKIEVDVAFYTQNGWLRIFLLRFYALKKSLWVGDMSGAEEWKLVGQGGQLKRPGVCTTCHWKDFCL